MIGKGTFIDDQHIIASSIAIGIAFINLCLPQEIFNQLICGVQEGYIDEGTYYEALFGKLQTVLLPYLDI